jgi:signal transduction histidine kinase
MSVRSSRERRIHETAGVAASIVGLLGFAYAPVLLFSGSPRYAVFLVVLGTLSLFSALLIRKGYFNPARHLFLAVGNIGSFVLTSGLHLASGSHYPFFAWAVMPMIIFGAREHRISVSWMVVSVSLFILSVNGSGVDRWFPNIVIAMDPSIYQALHSATAFASFVILTACVYWLQRSAEANELLLEDSVGRLRREKGRMEILLRGSMDAVFFLRPTTDVPSGKLKWVVAGVSRLVSRWVKDQRLRDIIGRPLTDVLSPHLSAALAPILQEVSTGAKIIEREFSFDEGGTQGVRFFRCALVSFAGEVALSLREITEEVSQKVNMEQMTRLSALGEMAGGVAHEINNPLTIIAMGVDHVLADPESEPFHPKLKRVRAAVDRISKIVQGMRTLSRRGEADRPQLISLEDVIQTTLEVCAEHFKYTGIEIERKGDAAAIQVLGNPVQLSQVLLNLLNNTRDALEDLEEKWVRIEAFQKDGVATIAVTDSGKGIDPQTQQKLFQPFFTTKGVGKGTGLGLSVSVRIMNSHAGELKYDSASPNTRFLMSLPVASAPATGNIPVAA